MVDKYYVVCVQLTVIVMMPVPSIGRVSGTANVRRTRPNTHDKEDWYARRCTFQPNQCLQNLSKGAKATFSMNKKRR